MFKFDMNLNELLYEDLPINTFANRITKAKLYAGISQEELSKLTGLSRSTINDLEAGYRNELNKNTLLKLLSVLNRNILCDDYCNFILDQEKQIKLLIYEFGINKLSEMLSVHKSTIERWRDCKYQINRKYYELLIKIKLTEV